MSMMWRYTLGTLVLWMLNPELRRLFEYRAGHSEISAFAVLPLLATVPHLYALTLGGGWKRLPPFLVVAAWVWIGAFTYGFLLSIAMGNVLPGFFTFVSYVVPMAPGLWIVSQDLPREVAFERVTRVLFRATTAVCAYGLIQYVFMPPWDRNWLLSVKYGTVFGRPWPFQVRVFSTFSDPIIFGAFVVFMILLSLPLLSGKRTWLPLQVAFWLVPLALTSSRSDWLMLGIGIGAYLVLSPKRGHVLSVVGIAVVAVLFGAAVITSGGAGNGIATMLTTRVDTFTGLDDDVSIASREKLYANAMNEIQEAPLGQGLGIVGLATKLGSGDQRVDFDSGVLARLIEMGYPGAALLLVVFVTFVGRFFLMWVNGLVSRNAATQDIAVVGLATLGVAIAFAFGSEIGGIVSLVLWMSVPLLSVETGAIPFGSELSAVGSL